MVRRILKSKFYLVNPYKRKIKPKPYDTGMKAQRDGSNKKLKETYVGFKGSNIPSLIKKGFKFSN